MSRIGNEEERNPGRSRRRPSDAGGPGRRASNARREPTLTNANLAELLARQAETGRPPVNRALRRAARHAFLWPNEAFYLRASDCPLTDLQSVGPHLEKIISGWLDDPPPVPEAPLLRCGFMTFVEAEAILAANPTWISSVKGDLQMHSLWSDGTASIREMAEAAIERDYEYIAITDHAKGLKIAGGIDEAMLRQQGAEIDAVNRTIEGSGRRLRVLRSIELNLNPAGEGDMDTEALSRLDIVIGCVLSSLRRKEDQTARYRCGRADGRESGLRDCAARKDRLQSRSFSRLAQGLRARSGIGQGRGDRCLSRPAGP